MGSSQTHNTHTRVETTRDTGTPSPQEEPPPGRYGILSFLKKMFSARKASGKRGYFRRGSLDNATKSENVMTGIPLLGLAALKKLRVEDVATPKAEIIAVPIDIGYKELISFFKKEGFSRLPVYEGTLDHPKGLVLLKDIAFNTAFGKKNSVSLADVLRPILYAPPSMPVATLLQKMQRERVHMALVIDEYGGVDGLVTIEDIVETLVGQIEDEHDEIEGPLWRQGHPGTYIAQAITPLEEFESEVKLHFRGEGDDDIDTLGGLVFRRAGRVPVRGEVVTHENGVEFEVIESDLRRVKRLKVVLPSARKSAPPAGKNPPTGAGKDETAMPAE